MGVALALSGCGGKKRATPATSSTSSSSKATTAPATTAGAATTAPSAGALQAEANAAATGDIPDNQVFLVFRNAAAGYSMKYPEGWAQSGSGGRLTFRDKNNIVRVVVLREAPASAATIRRDLAALKRAHVQTGLQRLTINGSPAFKVVYRTESAPNPVTGKRVTLVVDRYYLAHAGKEAIVDLGTPVGVDNVDAYRLMIESFRWR
ncbi:MAG TPA: hypothetical protein VFA44_07805 [Gaiellaceae bacterium]|nr:hypothetical protein [Gaiellaceae bacterium]